MLRILQNRNPIRKCGTTLRHFDFLRDSSLADASGCDYCE